jgi:hypothetical protein
VALVAPSIFASVAIFNSSSSLNDCNFVVTESDTFESMQFIVTKRSTAMVSSVSSAPRFAPEAAATVAAFAVGSTSSTSTMLASTPTTSAMEEVRLSSSASPNSLALRFGPEKRKSKVSWTSSSSAVGEDEQLDGSDKPHASEHDPHVKRNVSPS